MTLYLDACVLVALLGTEDDSEAVRGFVDLAAEPLVVSDFAAGEVASAISRLVRTDKLSMDEANTRLAAFDEWVAGAATPIATEAGDIRLAGRLVRKLWIAIRLPDAVHLAAAQIRSYTLVTLDRRMASAAEQIGLPVVLPALH